MSHRKKAWEPPPSFTLPYGMRREDLERLTIGRCRFCNAYTEWWPAYNSSGRKSPEPICVECWDEIGKAKWEREEEGIEWTS